MANTFWNALLLLATLLTAFVPAYVAYDLYKGGPSPEKKIQLLRFGTVDPIHDFGIQKRKISLSITDGGQQLDNLVVVTEALVNSGKAPILPTDFYENLSVNVDKRWQILFVENYGENNKIQLVWKKISDTRFEAEPALLNPGDTVFAQIYLTDTRRNDSNFDSEKSDSEKKIVEWRTRIVNLHEIEERSAMIMRDREKYFGVYVELYGWSLPFVIITAAIFISVYLNLLLRTKVIAGWSARSIVIVVAVSIFSFVVSEVSATYIFGNMATQIQRGVTHWMNAPWLVLHVALMAYLYYVSYRQQRA